MTIEDETIMAEEVEVKDGEAILDDFLTYFLYGILGLLGIYVLSSPRLIPVLPHLSSDI